MAFAELYSRHAMTSITTAHAVCADDAHDVVQDVWTKIWLSPPDIAVDFGAWLRVVIRRRARETDRRRRRVGTLGESLLGDHTSPTRELARREAVAVLEHARSTGQITEAEYLAIIDGTGDDSSTEIAKAWSLSPSGWRCRLYRARSKLRAIVGG